MAKCSRALSPAPVSWSPEPLALGGAEPWSLPVLPSRGVYGEADELTEGQMEARLYQAQGWVTQLPFAGTRGLGQWALPGWLAAQLGLVCHATPGARGFVLLCPGVICRLKSSTHHDRNPGLRTTPRLAGEVTGTESPGSSTLNTGLPQTPSSLRLLGLLPH